MGISGAPALWTPAILGGRLASANRTGRSTIRPAEERSGGVRCWARCCLIVLVVLLLGALPSWPYSRGWGYYPSGIFGTVLLIIVVLLVLGYL